VAASGPGPLTLLTLDNVACAGGACLVVGSGTGRDGGRLRFTLHWDGTGWSRVADAPGNLRSLACLRPDRCLADARYSGFGEAEVWDPSGWTTPRLFGASGDERGRGVSCVADDRCLELAVSPAGGTVGVTWDGTTFTDVPGPPLSRIDNVSCGSATDCLALGLGDGGFAAYAWDGTAWTATAAPARAAVGAEGSAPPVDGTIPVVAGLSCLPAWCMLAASDAVPGTGPYSSPRRPAAQLYRR
jgi:hypothetical protein